MQSSVLCGVRVNMMERRPLVAIGRKATDRIRDNPLIVLFLLFSYFYLLFFGNVLLKVIVYFHPISLISSH